MVKLIRSLKSVFSLILTWVFIPLFIIFALFWALWIRYRPRPLKPRLVWGSTPIINNSYWARSMRKIGYQSETFTQDFYSSINKRTDWDRIISEEYSMVPFPAKCYVAFLDSLKRYDIFFLSFDGFFLGKTPVRYFQNFFFKIARKKVVMIPYGSDSYVYSRIRSTSLIHGLMMSYPQAAKIQNLIAKNVDYWCRHADAVLAGIMGPDGFGRWEILVPTILYIDLDLWQSSGRLSTANGIDGVVKIVHAPNHRGFKGSEFIVEAVRQLQREGLNIELILLEKMQNSRVREILQSESDILVEQLIATGHGMNGLEGLASGLPVISNLENEDYILPMRRWSYFNECPIVSASPESLVQVLRKLVTRPDLRHELGAAGRAYVEKYHGLDSAQYIFSNVIELLQGKKDSLINLFHPITGEYPQHKPKITHPLVNNMIVD